MNTKRETILNAWNSAWGEGDPDAFGQLRRSRKGCAVDQYGDNRDIIGRGNLNFAPNPVSRVACIAKVQEPLLADDHQ